MTKRTWLVAASAVALVAAAVAAFAIATGNADLAATVASILPWSTASASPELGLHRVALPPMRWYAQVGDPLAPLKEPAPRAMVPPPEFDATAAMADIRALAALGPRGGGSEAEARAAEYLRARLEAIGLSPRIEMVPLPNGTTTRNVIARVEGSSEEVLVLGGHYDSKPPSPGANDNASGCAVLLQVAEIFTEQVPPHTLEFVFFGAEEILQGNPDYHHFGSRYRVKQMSADERAKTAGMISVDMIGYGSEFNVMTMGVGPQSLSDALLAHAKAEDVAMSYRKDKAKSGSSDHEAFERAGLPAACVSARKDPTYHTVGDTAAHVARSNVATAGQFVVGFVYGGEAARLAGE